LSKWGVNRQAPTAVGVGLDALDAAQSFDQSGKHGD
jgi:hypothetical protein